MSGDGTLNADVAMYNSAVAADSGPPSITSDPLVDGPTPIEQLLRALGLAANSGDALDESAGVDDYIQRDAAMTDAADGFAHQDSSASTEMSQLPQLAAGIAGALAGALTGALAPVMQLPAQLAQGTGQALQAGTALVSGYRAEDPAMSESQDYSDLSSADPFTGDPGLPDDPGLTDDLSGLSGPASGSTTSPMALLGPAPTPSATTAPASATPSAVRTASTTPPPTAGLGGMAGMPMIPPGPLSTASTNTAVPPDTKRATVPAVHNGAPVQGRIVGLPVPRTLEGRPVEARRIVAPREDLAGGS